MPGLSLHHAARLLTAGVLVLLTGCGTSDPLQRASSATQQAAHLPPTTEIETETRLMTAADDWLGVPYRFGGTSQSGVDCSALVRAVYAGAFGLRLTRSTRTQVREGREVDRGDLRTGDLVFFRTGRNQRHVGIYLDGDRLLHASSSQDRVLVDDFSKEHFQQTYWTARRLLDVDPRIPVRPPVIAQAPPAPTPETPRSGPARSGW